MTDAQHAKWELRRAFLGSLRARWWTNRARRESGLEEFELQHLDRAAEVLNALAKEPLADCRRVLDGDRAALDELANSLWNWMERFRLRAAWIGPVALGTLDLWCRVPHAHRRRLWRQPTFADYESTQALVLNSSAWSTRFERRSEAKRRIRAEVEQQLERVFEKMDQAPSDEPPVFRDPWQMVWLVRAVVLKESWRVIAKDWTQASPGSVSKAVHRLAAQLSLPVPRQPVGRPPRARP